MTASVIPLRLSRWSGPPAWLHDDTIVGHALDAKRTPPSPKFWQRLANLAQIGAQVIDGRVRDDFPTRVGVLLTALAVELDTLSAVGSEAALNGLGWPEFSSRPARGSVTAQVGDPSPLGDDGDRGQPGRPPAEGAGREDPRVTDRHIAPRDDQPLEQVLARLIADTADLAAHLIDPRPPDLRDIARTIDHFGTAVRGMFRHHVVHPSSAATHNGDTERHHGDTEPPGRDPPRPEP